MKANSIKIQYPEESDKMEIVLSMARNNETIQKASKLREIAEQIIKEVEEKKKKYKDKIERDIKEIALRYYACRIWEITDWVGYELFNNLYMQGEMQLTM